MNYIQKVFLFLYILGIINALYLTCNSCGRPSRAGMGRLKNLWHTYPKWHAERFSWFAVFIIVRFFLIYFPRTASLHCEEYVCVCVCVYIYICLYIYTYIHIYIYTTAYRLYMNYHCYQITLH